MFSKDKISDDGAKFLGKIIESAEKLKKLLNINLR